jgi:hypothetical protein
VDLLILGEAYSGAPNYRGTGRASPTYCDGLGDDHPANQAFFWMCREGGEELAVHNLAKARALIAAYALGCPDQHFEIVEATYDDPPETQTSQLLGYDLLAGYGYSLLSWGLEIGRKPLDDLPGDDLLRVLQPPLSLVRESFQPRLNANGLFDDKETAEFCLACMMALQQIRPNLWENETVTFDVVGLWQVQE